MGRSYVTEQPVAGQLARRTVPTAQLTVAALAMALLVAVPMGILSARRRGTPVDTLARLMALVGAAAPSYALAYGLIILFAVKLSWLPALGYGSAAQVVLPAVALSLAPMAQLMRLIRASMLETLGQDYIRTARAKGLSEQSVALGHALRNALLPAIGATGVSLGYLLSGAVIVETIFTWPGLGQLMVGAALTRDYPVVQGFVTYIAVVVLLVNLAADVASARRRSAPAVRTGRDVTHHDWRDRTGTSLHASRCQRLAPETAVGRAAAGAGNRAGVVPGGISAVGGVAGALATPGRSHRDQPARTAALALNAGHLLGTDHLGRDTFSRVVHGARLTLLAAAVTLALSMTIALTVGILSGYHGGWADTALMGVVDLLLAFPSLILALAVAGALGPGLLNVLLAAGAVWWVGHARIIRGVTLGARQMEYVMAARAAGAGNLRIIVRHITPNILGPIIVIASLDVGWIILGIAGLNFLGLGAQPPTPEWGAMLNDARPHLQTAPRSVAVAGGGHIHRGAGFQPAGRRATRRA